MLTSRSVRSTVTADTGHFVRNNTQHTHTHTHTQHTQHTQTHTHAHARTLTHTLTHTHTHTHTHTLDESSVILLLASSIKNTVTVSIEERGALVGTGQMSR